MEYKCDEFWTYDQTRIARDGHSFPCVGMPTSVGPANPGMSIWVFLALANVFQLHTPTELARGIQLMNILAIVLLIYFVVRCVPRAEWEPWLWAAALIAVNPVAVLFERKIWPPSVLPIFVSLTLMSWWQRRHFSGAFCWGFLGLIMGQIHLGGFFFMAGLAGWAFLFDRKSVSWKGWLAGAALGALPLIPWLAYISAHPGLPSERHWRIRHILECKFWIRWTTEPLGLGLDYALGQDFLDFLQSPRWNGQPTFLVGICHAAALAAGIGIFIRAARRAWKNRSTTVALLDRPPSPTATLLCAALWGFGILLTLSGMTLHRHYMAIAHALEALWLAWLALPRFGAQPSELKRGRIFLGTLCLAQALITFGFLSYVHARQTIDGDYGTTYRALMSAGRPYGSPGWGEGETRRLLRGPELIQQSPKR
jgi:hypothetical protein